MQYHFDGFKPGDPHVSNRHEAPTEPLSEVDVLIVGCGPAGLTLAAQLSAFPDITTRIVERKAGPLKIGQADGIACRSMEMFEAFGFADRVKKEAYWVSETVFWRPIGQAGALIRADRIQDVEDDLSEMPHTILSQARVHDFYLQIMENAPRPVRPDYGVNLCGLERTDNVDHPVVATFESAKGRAQHTVRAKYVVGCDGARSAVREALGYQLKGESARQLWGVMDVLAVTNFPDIRLKCAIQSADQGSVLVIPREGGTLVRMYIELDALTGDERAVDRGVTPEMLIARAQAVLTPYTFDVKEVAWCSAYEIGQRVCDQFDDHGDGGVEFPRIFIAGDACHTHSPKAGQGMNVSMADTFNLGWKLATVLLGHAAPDLLKTYSQERQAKARELIAFDRDMAKLFSSRSADKGSAELFQSYFQKHGRYTAGVETRYDPSMVVMDASHQKLATGLTVGMRFHSAPVIRVADARPMQLGEVLKADGRWRLIVFVGNGDNGQPGGELAALCAHLGAQQDGLIRRYTPAGHDIDSIIDLRAVLQGDHRQIAIEKLPELLTPAKGRFGLTDYEKLFCSDLKNGPDVFVLRGLDRQSGALVIVRPDQFVAGILPLSDRTSLAAFFDGFMIPNDAEM